MSKGCGFISVIVAVTSTNTRGRQITRYTLETVQVKAYSIYHFKKVEKEAFCKQKNKLLFSDNKNAKLCKLCSNNYWININLKERFHHGNLTILLSLLFVWL